MKNFSSTNLYRKLLYNNPKKSKNLKRITLQQLPISAKRSKKEGSKKLRIHLMAILKISIRLS
jgi:hypothetical protein